MDDSGRGCARCRGEEGVGPLVVNPELGVIHYGWQALGRAALIVLIQFG